MFRVLKNIRIKDQKNLFSSFLHVVDKKPKTNYLHSYIVRSFRSFPFSFLKKEKKIYRTLILGILIDRKRKFKYFDVIKPYDAWK